MIVDNNEFKTEAQATKRFKMLVKKGLSKFVKAPIKNSIGKKWVKRARLLKKQGIK